MTRNEMREHNVDWLGVYRGSESDPREIGYCPVRDREVTDGDGTHVAPGEAWVFPGECWAGPRLKGGTR